MDVFDVEILSSHEQSPRISVHISKCVISCSHLSSMVETQAIIISSSSLLQRVHHIVLLYQLLLLWHHHALLAQMIRLGQRRPSSTHLRGLHERVLARCACSKVVDAAACCKWVDALNSHILWYWCVMLIWLIQLIACIFDNRDIRSAQLLFCTHISCCFCCIWLLHLTSLKDLLRCWAHVYPKILHRIWLPILEIIMLIGSHHALLALALAVSLALILWHKLLLMLIGMVCWIRSYLPSSFLIVFLLRQLMLIPHRVLTSMFVICWGCTLGEIRVLITRILLPGPGMAMLLWSMSVLVFFK